MLLKSILKSLRDEEAATASLLDLNDLALLAEIDHARLLEGLTRGEYAVAAVSRFCDQAGDDEWLALVTAIQNDAAPANACLASMIRHALRQDHAMCVSRSACHHHAGHAHGPEIEHNVSSTDDNERRAQV